VGAKKVREDLSYVRMLANSDYDVVMSLAPSFFSEFPGIAPARLIEAIKGLGIKAVEFTANAAEVLNVEIDNYLLEQKPCIAISQCCPSVVQLINKYFSQNNSDILHLLTPMLAHGKILKEKYGKQVKVIFAGPCISKKNEADRHPGLIDGVITFKRLKEWLEDEGLFPEESSEDQTPVNAPEGLVYPVEGGMLKGLKNRKAAVDYDYMSFSGLEQVKDVLRGLDNWEPERPVFLELLACAGGCINGPGSSCKNSVIHKRSDILQYYHTHKNEKQRAKAIGLDQKLYTEDAVKNRDHSALEIQQALERIDKHGFRDELNCGGCGYATCRDFASAMIEDRAESEMCVSYMRNVAHDKASLLLQKMPYGVVIVDEHMKIMESNEHFARLLGEEISIAFECDPGLEGADMQKLFPEHGFFSSLLSSGNESMEKDLRLGDKLVHLSLFTIQPKKLVCGIFQNMKQPEVQKEEIVRRTRKVIKENLKTVQEIAFLLGENASNTETMLNSIVESFHGEKQGHE